MMRELTGRRSDRPSDIFYWEDDRDPDNVFVLFANRSGGVTLATSETFPMDSYNETFECKAVLSADDAKRLRDYLLAEFPITLSP